MGDASAAPSFEGGPVKRRREDSSPRPSDDVGSAAHAQPAMSHGIEAQHAQSSRGEATDAVRSAAADTPSALAVSTGGAALPLAALASATPMAVSTHASPTDGATTGAGATADLAQQLEYATSHAHNMWELLRRMHDMIVVFDIQGLIAFVSPASDPLLGYRPEQLFDQPLAHILAPECHAEFEAHIQRMMGIQQTRPLMGAELASAYTFLHRDGRRIVLDGVGQAWQRGEVIEFVFTYRDATLSDFALQARQTLTASTRASFALTNTAGKPDSVSMGDGHADSESGAQVPAAPAPSPPAAMSTSMGPAAAGFNTFTQQFVSQSSPQLTGPQAASFMGGYPSSAYPGAPPTGAQMYPGPGMGMQGRGPPMQSGFAGAQAAQAAAAAAAYYGGYGTRLGAPGSGYGDSMQMAPGAYSGMQGGPARFPGGPAFAMDPSMFMGQAGPRGVPGPQYGGAAGPGPGAAAYMHAMQGYPGSGMQGSGSAGMYSSQPPGR